MGQVVFLIRNTFNIWISQYKNELCFICISKYCSLHLRTESFRYRVTTTDVTGYTYSTFFRSNCIQRLTNLRLNIPIKKPDCVRWSRNILDKYPEIYSTAQVVLARDVNVDIWTISISQVYPTFCFFFQNFRFSQLNIQVDLEELKPPV